jgi:hypothetical protein
MADIRDLIRKRALAAGLDPLHALAVAKIESDFNPQAVSPSGRHRGLYQMGDWEFKNYGSGADPFDPQANVDSFFGYQKHAKDFLTKGLGREPTPEELYLAHQQGPTGALKLLTNPDLSASEVVGWEAVKANRGTADMTASQFADLWRNKYKDAAKGFTGNTGTETPSTLPPLPPSQTVGAAPGMQEPTDGLLASPSIPYGGGDYWGPDSPATPEATAKGVKMAQGLLDRDRRDAGWRAADAAASLGRGLLSMGSAPAPMAAPEIRYPSMQPIAPAPSYRPQGQGLLADPLRRKRGILGA